MSVDEFEVAPGTNLRDLFVEFGQEVIAEQYKETYDQAIREFTAERLKSYYLAHPNVAEKAKASLLYAQSLLASHPRAALVFATSAVELAIKVVLLQPVIYGLVHQEALAPFIMELATQHTGAKRFYDLLFEILKRFGGVNLKEFRRPGSSKPLWEELNEVQSARNLVLHRGETVDDSFATLAIEIAATLLNPVFLQVLRKLDLHLHEPGIVCSKRHTVGFAVHFPIPGHIPSISGTVELNLEDVDLDNMPETITGRLLAEFSTGAVLALRSAGTRIPMWITSTVLRYEISFAPNSDEFTGTKITSPPPPPASQPS